MGRTVVVRLAWGCVVLLSAAGAVLAACVADEPADGVGQGDSGAIGDGASDAVTGDAAAGCGDTTSDPSNCGACGTVCAVGTQCMQSACKIVTVDVSAGYTSACALRSDGSVWCWGENQFGDVGVDPSGDVSCSATNFSCRPEAVKVPIESVVQVSAGAEYACAVKTDNTVWCWGKNHRGQLGHDNAGDTDGGGTAYNATPTKVTGLPAASRVFAGIEATCALTTAGALYCWGNTGNDELLRDAGAGLVFTSAPGVTGLANVDDVSIAISFSDTHLCAHNANGTETCWADNIDGERGSASANDGPPSLVLDSDSGTATGITTISSGKFASCALRGAGELWCWGFNHYGYFANPTTAETNVTSASKSSAVTTSFTAISGRTQHVCAIATDKSIYCWGEADHGELGTGTVDGGAPNYSSVPLQVVGGIHATKISVGDAFAVVVRDDGTTWAWGDNTNGTAGHAQSPSDVAPCYGANTYCTVTPTQVRISGADAGL